MWQKIADPLRENAIKRAVEFTGNAPLYGRWMMEVLERWPISSEQNLSNTSINRQAWIGHAAAWLAISSPEDITRSAWWLLTERQRDEANAMADKAIAEFETR